MGTVSKSVFRPDSLTERPARRYRDDDPKRSRQRRRPSPPEEAAGTVSRKLLGNNTPRKPRTRPPRKSLCGGLKPALPQPSRTCLTTCTFHAWHVGVHATDRLSTQKLLCELGCGWQAVCRIEGSAGSREFDGAVFEENVCVDHLTAPFDVTHQVRSGPPAEQSLYLFGKIKQFFTRD